MSGRVNLPDPTLTLANAVERIRILEALVPVTGGGGGGVSFCTGCWDIDPDFANCVDLFGADEIPVDETVIPQGQTGVSPVGGTFLQIGPYECNYAAGFRVQGRYTGLFGEGQGHLYMGVAHDGGTPGALGWQLFADAQFDPAANTDTGWVTFDIDPGGSGNLNDPWQFWLGATNTSVLFDSQVGPGKWHFRYISTLEDGPNTIPAPTVPGQLLVSNGSPPVWTLIDPGTPGQVLTMGAVLPDWA